MKNERLLIVTVSVVIGSGCLAFGLSTDDYQSLKIAEDAEVIEEVTVARSVKAGNPIEGTGIVIEINDNGFMFIDSETGAIRFSHANGLNGSIMLGDEVTYIYITTPNGTEVVRQIKKKVN